MHALRRFREREGLTLQGLAARVGMSKATLSRIETGKQVTSVGTIQRLIAATGGSLTPNDFIGPLESGEPAPRSSAQARR